MKGAYLVQNLMKNTIEKIRGVVNLLKNQMKLHQLLQRNYQTIKLLVGFKKNGTCSRVLQ